jgi:hypothetical protein
MTLLIQPRPYFIHDHSEEGGSRGMRLLTVPAVSLLLAVALSGCGHTSQPGARSGPVSQYDPSTRVDPQIFSDAAAGAFPMPGPSQLQTIHVTLASIGLPNAACGGENFRNLSDTSFRFDQARYADLDLIAGKGLAEPEMRQPIRAPEACRARKTPTFSQWYMLAAAWRDATATAAKASRVMATHAKTTRCLQRASGLRVDYGDPTASYLAAVDYALSGLKSAEASSSLQHKFSVAFVQCTKSYFSALATQLEPMKERLVRRNKKLLERYAAELAALGYVPYVAFEP